MDYVRKLERKKSIQKEKINDQKEDEIQIEEIKNKFSEKLKLDATIRMKYYSLVQEMTEAYQYLSFAKNSLQSTNEKLMSKEVQKLILCAIHYCEVNEKYRNKFCEKFAIKIDKY